MAKSPQQPVTPGGYQLPPGSPPGLLAFLVGIQANESGFDYYRDQGSAPGSVDTYGAAEYEGFGAYQFTGPQSSQVQQAEAAGWAPAVQDEIAAQMATAYYDEATKGGATPEQAWAAATEGWYGPGTIVPHGWSGADPVIPGNDVLSNPDAPSAADWANVRAALSGQPNLPDAWVYGPGHTGLTSAEVGAELKGQQVPAAAALADFPGGNWDPLNWPGAVVGGAANAVGGAVSSTAGSLLKPIGILLLKLTLTAIGGALVVIGLAVTTSTKPSAGMPFLPQPSEAPAGEAPAAEAAPAASAAPELAAAAL